MSTETHAPYVQAVADALNAAGITVAEWRDVTDEYLDAYINLAERDADGALRMLGWDEEHGWAFHVGEPGDALIWWICDDVLPEPGQVVEAARRCVAGDFPPVVVGGACYRSFTDEDDFTSRLAAYGVVGGRRPVTVPTPENVAESLTSGDNDYHDGNDWWTGLSAVGNVLDVTITPCDEDGEQCEKVHFEAHVFEVEPPAPVASEPVELPADLARELAYSDAGDTIGGWTVVANDHIDDLRWESVHRLVIRNEAGQHFADTYRQGLTEHQDTSPWEYESVARFTPVERRAKVVRSFEWVKPAAPSGSPSDLDVPEEPISSGDDGTCGDCETGKCHGTEPDECGCARHDVSIAGGDQ